MPSLSPILIWLALLLLQSPQQTSSMGSLPDASQEGLLDQYSGYASLAIFHYTVPAETARATWEFACFQDRADCPHRTANIVIQHGSYPVFSAGDNASFPDTFYLQRTALTTLRTVSDYQPSDAAVHPVYNPLPGSWFAVAYLSPYEQYHGLLERCRYSLGSVALWSKAEGVESIMPNVVQTFRTRRHFSYYKFYITEEVGAFALVISNCVVRVRHPRPNFGNDSCLDFVDIRAESLPFHAMDSHTAFRNVSAVSGNATFYEPRPHKATTYYILVVSHGEVSFDVTLNLRDCGETGLYGKKQKDWFLSAGGLMFESNNSSKQPKEPTTGFQLFAKSKMPKDSDDKLNFKLFQNVSKIEDEEAADLEEVCHSTFDFTRIESVNEFAVNYLLQGRSWYTKWLTVLEDSPLVTRFDTLAYLDVGGFVNINLLMDERKMNSFMYQIVRACLERNRDPDVVSCSGDAVMEVSDYDNTTLQALKVIPYPEPGKWHLGFQTRCVVRKTGKVEPCPSSLKAAMVSVDLQIQPCDYRPLQEMCGKHGSCAKITKGFFRISSCSCSSGRKGYTCEDESEAGVQSHLLHTLLLTLTNLAFLPAVILALHYRLWAEALVYGATMAFSAFYHACDQGGMSQEDSGACMELYVNREVLQFCDFFCATLSFWVTIISLARLPAKVTNFMNMLGVLLVATLVQYNRTGIAVFAIPIPLGLLVLLVSVQVKGCRRKRKLFCPNKYCLVLFLPAAACAIVALCLVGFVETTANYPYIHGVWHVLMGASLLFLLPRCNRTTVAEKKVVLVKEEEEDDSLSSNSTEEEEVSTKSEEVVVVTEEC